jgi:hypothetical protein
MRVLDSGIDNSTGLVSDHHVRLTGVLSTTRYPEALQCGTFIDEQTDKQFESLTNNFAFLAITIYALYSNDGKSKWVSSLT